MRKKLKVLAVDFDGTLVESNEIKDKAFDSIFSKWPEHREAMMRWHLADNTMARQDKFRYFVEVILGQQGNEELIEKLIRRFSELSYKAIVNCKMVDGAKEFLDDYVSRVQLFLVSATPHNELKKILVISNISYAKDGKFKNKTFMFTGKLEGISRAEAKSLVEKNAGKIVSSVSKKLDYLIIGNKPTNRKVNFAKELNVKVINQSQWQKMLN